MPIPWPAVKERTIGSRRAYAGHLISLRVDDIELSSGRHAEREIVEHPGAVAIVAWDGTRLAMVRQWRHAANREMLEIPAGTLDPGEEVEQAARRELAEETQVAAERWERGPSFFTAPGFCTERLTLFLASDLRPEPAAAADDEELEPMWLTLGEAHAAIDRGEVEDAKSLVGILWLARRLAGQRSAQGD